MSRSGCPGARLTSGPLVGCRLAAPAFTCLRAFRCLAALSPFILILGWLGAGLMGVGVSGWGRAKSLVDEAITTTLRLARASMLFERAALPLSRAPSATSPVPGFSWGRCTAASNEERIRAATPPQRAVEGRPRAWRPVSLQADLELHASRRRRPGPSAGAR
jgi:hypothetical protein